MSVGTIMVIVIIIAVWGWIFYEMRIAPEVDENDNIINTKNKEKKRQFDWVNSVFKDKKEDVE